MSDSKRKPALIVGSTERGILVHQQGDDHVREMRPVVEGKPLSSTGELITLHGTHLSPMLWEAESHGRVCDSGTGHSGPARVSSPRFRSNYEATFGKKEDRPN